MRKSRFCVTMLGLMVGATPCLGGFGLIPSTQPELATSSLSPNQVVPPLQTWDDHINEVLRRWRERLGNPAPNPSLSLKDSAAIVRTLFEFEGLPPDLTAADLEEMSADAFDLAGCASLDPKPSYGTSYELIVYLHDLGVDLQKALDVY